MDEAKAGDLKLRRVKSGPHVEKRLSAAFVRSAPPGRHADGGGLFLQVDPSGARRWLLRTTVRGKRRDLGLGSAKLVSLAEAREKALDLRRIARAGGNPSLRTREKVGEGLSFEELARTVHEKKFADRANNGKHIGQWIRTLEMYAFPIIGKLSVAEISQDDIEAVLDPIWTEKPETAKRTLQRITAVFDHACGRGYRSRGNPATGLARLMRDQRHKPGHFEALDYKRIPRLMAELQPMKTVGARALAFTILTAARSGSVRAATWSQFSSDLRIWTIPAEHMKMKEEFEVPLSMSARDLIRSLRDERRRDDDLVFCSPRNARRPISENTMRKVLQEHFPGATVHGMRAAFRTWAADEVDARDDVAEAALAHAAGSKTVRAYKRTQLLDQREMLMEKWAMWADGEIEWFSNYNDIEEEIRRRWEEPIG